MAMKLKFKLFGRCGEELVRDWLKENGWHVVPTSLIDTGRAPLLEGHLRNFVLPDILAAKVSTPKWIDVKTKGRMTKNQKRQRWETGCELRNWRDYVSVQINTGIKGALAFVHLDPPRLLLGDLDDIGKGAAIWEGPFHSGHAFKEPMIFFDVGLFSWFYLEESLLFHRIHTAAIEPQTIRLWETAGAPKEKPDTQGYLF